MIELPFPITLKNVQEDIEVSASIVRLTSGMARDSIDFRWWKPIPCRDDADPLHDDHWVWMEDVLNLGEYRTIECVAITTSDGDVQGAMILDLSGESQIEAGKGAAEIDRIAAAPWNRARYAKDPLYEGIGKSMLAWACWQSYLQGWEGRIRVSALSSAIQWYLDRGFIQTAPLAEAGELVDLELPKHAALRALRSRGLIS
ncbi:hypothetical protein TA3x_003826 [Tundrisphaera sp. TA3]|uniref:hypothetical protein n=1 Tax=Tundrisphaera sp. TA3 TaxID=3435775 RepID=UPI003EB8E96F